MEFLGPFAGIPLARAVLAFQPAKKSTSNLPRPPGHPLGILRRTSQTREKHRLLQGGVIQEAWLQLHPGACLRAPKATVSPPRPGKGRAASMSTRACGRMSSPFAAQPQPQGMGGRSITAPAPGFQLSWRSPKVGFLGLRLGPGKIPTPPVTHNSYCLVSCSQTMCCMFA